MRNIEDSILAILWGIVISCSILSLSFGLLTDTDFIFTLLNIQALKNNPYITFTFSVILGILLAAYQILRKRKPKKQNTETSSAIMKQMPFTPIEFKPLGQNVILFFLLSIPLMIALLNVYMMIVPSNTIFDGLLSLDMNNLHKERMECLERIGICLFIGIGLYWSLQEKYCILEEGFIHKASSSRPSSAFRNVLIPWKSVEKVVIEAVPRMCNLYDCKLILHGKPPDYFKEKSLIANTWKAIPIELGFIRRSDLEKAKDAISRRVIVEYREMG